MLRCLIDKVVVHRTAPDRVHCWVVWKGCETCPCPQRRPPSPSLCRVGTHVRRFEACSRFTRVTTCPLAASPERHICLEGSDCPRCKMMQFSVLPSRPQPHLMHSRGLVPYLGSLVSSRNLASFGTKRRIWPMAMRCPPEGVVTRHRYAVQWHCGKIKLAM
jgi:hypothetical protein